MTEPNVYLKAIAFASKAHSGQFRKDGKTPYISHTFRVSVILRDVFGVTDEKALAAAVLHDVIEDTTTDFDDIEEQFGSDIAVWVGCLTKDKRQKAQQREKDYYKGIGEAPDVVKLVKLADLLDNTLDGGNSGSKEAVGKTISKLQHYVALIRPYMNTNTAGAFKIVEEALKCKLDQKGAQ